MQDQQENPKNSPPTQEQLDAAGDIYSKLKLLSPERYTNLCERTLSLLFSKVTKPYCCYNTTRKKWMFYNGKYWNYDDGNVQIRRIVKRFAYDMLRYASDVTSSDDDKFYLLAYSLGKASARASLIKDSVDNNIVSDEELDTDPYLINLENGTFDLNNMALRKHSYKDMISKMANVSYIPGSQNCILDQFMESVFSGDQDLINYIYRVFGLCLSGETSPEAFWVFLGETSRNGKSTLLCTFAHMLGGPSGYAVNCDVSSLAQKKYYNGSAPSSDIARLKGARFVVASEPPLDFKLDEAKIKALTGGDKITARMLRANDVEYTPTFKIFIGTNHRPVIADDSVLNSNRIRVVPFLKHFDESEQNKNLKEQLKDPKVQNALFIKSLEGWQQYKQSGLEEPMIVKETIAEYKTSGQVFALFLETCFERNDGAKISLADFYPIYEKWCTENDFAIGNKHEIIRHMRSKGIFKSSGTINGKTHRNILLGYKLSKEYADSTENSTPEKQLFLSDFLENSNHEPWANGIKENDPQITPFEDQSLW